MTSENDTVYRPPNLTLFLLVSFILHSIFILVFNYFYTRTPEAEISTAILSVVLQAPTAITKKNDVAESIKSSTTDTQKKIPNEQIPTSKETKDAWQKGMETVRKIIQQPGFLDKLLENKSSIPNYREDLFDTKKTVTQTTIESYNNLTSGEIYVVFRYPSGKVICARAREPDPFDNFDTGSWVIEINGCK